MKKLHEEVFCGNKGRILNTMNVMQLPAVPVIKKQKEHFESSDGISLANVKLILELGT